MSSVVRVPAVTPALTLSAPDAVSSGPEVETHPRRVRAWLERLPLLDIAGTGGQVLAALQALNRRPVRDKARFVLLELYRGPVERLCQAIEREYVGRPLPLPDAACAWAQRHRELQVEMAYGYKRLVRNALGSPARAAPALAVWVQRALSHLTGVLLQSYLCYGAYPPRTWIELHALYRLAEDHGLLHTPVDDPLNGVAAPSTVDHAYKRALLLEFCSPYHLPSAMTRRVHRYLARAAYRARLLPATAHHNPTCRFLIDPQADRAGVAYTADTAIQNPAAYRLLNAYEVVQGIERELAALRAGRGAALDDLEPDMRGDGGPELLTRLLQVWGAPPVRGFRRRPRAGEPTAVLIGLIAIHDGLNGPTPPAAADPGAACWRLMDESAGGMAFLVAPEAGRALRVGELIATRAPAAGAPWAIATVRWIHRAGGGDIEIGTERLAPCAEPVAIRLDEDGHVMPALLLPPIEPLRQPPSLLTHRGLFRPGRALRLDTGTGVQRIVLTELVDLTTAFGRCQFRIE